MNNNLIHLIKTNCTAINGVIQHQLINKYLKNHPNLKYEFESKTSFLSNGESLALKFKALEQGITCYNKCEICGKKLKKLFKEVCSQQCSAKLTRKKIKEKYNVTSPMHVNKFKEKNLKKKKETMLRKYGVENPMQIEGIKEKIKQTNLKKYGCENPQQNKQIREKTKQTNLKKYGVEYPIQSNEIKEKIKNTMLSTYNCINPMQVDIFKEKAIETNLKKYGVPFIFQSDEFKEKRIQTNLIKYGVEYPTQSNEIKEKIKQTNLIKYGYSCVLQSEEIIEKGRQKQIQLYGEIMNFASKIHRKKAEQTCMNRYGVKNYFEYINLNGGGMIFARKEFVWPSGKIEMVQGYEPIVLEELLQKYDEYEILVSRKDMPVFKYKGIDNKEHRYFPDIYVPHKNLIIEVKSEYTMNVDLPTNLLKAECVRKAGFNFEFQIR